MKRHEFPLLTVLLGLSLLSMTFTACGDDGSSSAEEPINSVTTKARLPECEKSLDGAIYYVEKEDAYYVCDEGFWDVNDYVPQSANSSSSDKIRSSSSLEISESDTAKVKPNAIKSVTVSGVAQKGPFVNGSVVTVTGLDSLFEETEEKYKGTVSGDSGGFVVKDVSLKNQFAAVKVSGNFVKEISGKKTSAKSTLNAIADLSQSAEVNITLFSHLVASRALYLAKEKQFNMNAALTKAYAELGSVVSDYTNQPADSLVLDKATLSGKSQSAALLYAWSVLVEGDLSVAMYVKRLNIVTETFAETGSFDDDDLLQTLSDMADFASEKDSAGGYKDIRSNAESLKLGIVPNFEPLLTAFWNKDYGLGSCVNSLEETLKENQDKRSVSAGKKFVCTSGRWHMATALEQEIGLCTKKNVGESKETKDAAYYCEDGEWHKMTDLEKKEGLCRDSTKGKEISFDRKGYYCDGKNWIEKTALENEIGLCRDSSRGILGISKSGSYYVCGLTDWEETSFEEYHLGFCDVSTAGNFRYIDGDPVQYYFCADNNKWMEISEVDYSMGNICDGTKVDSVGWTGEYYPDSLSDFYVKKLPLDTLGVIPGDYYICTNGGWQKTEHMDYWYGSCDNRNEGAFANAAQIFKNTTPDSVLQFDGILQAIVGSLMVSVAISPDTSALAYAQCQKGRWTPVNYVDVKLGKLGKVCDSLTPIKTIGETGDGSLYECFNGSWANAIRDSRDKKIYRTVTIGEQTWMADNLNYQDSVSTPNLKGQITQCPTYYTAEKCLRYGPLYSWTAAVNVDSNYSSAFVLASELQRKGICPEGFHIPDTTEYSALIKEVGGKKAARDKLRSTSEWYSEMDGGKRNGTDEYGFTAWPAGEYDPELVDLITDDGQYAYFWTTTQSVEKDTIAYFMSLSVYENSDMFERSGLQNWKKHNRYSVRCIKD